MTFMGPLLLVEVPDDGSARTELASALTAFGRVTFRLEPVAPPLGAAWEARGEDFVRELPLAPGRVWTRSLTEQLGFAEMRGIVCTRRTSAVAALFDAALADHEVRTGLVTPAEAPPPALHEGHLDDLVSEAWADAARALGAVVAVRVDGRIVSHWASDPATLDALARDLESRTWSMVDADDFTCLPPVP